MMTDSRWNTGGSREQSCHRPQLNSKIKKVLFSDSVLTQYVLFCQPAAAKLTLCVCVCQRGRSPPWNLYGGCWRGRRGRRDHSSVWKVQKCRSAIKVASSKNLIQTSRVKIRRWKDHLHVYWDLTERRAEGAGFYCHVKSKAMKHEKTGEGEKSTCKTVTF